MNDSTDTKSTAAALAADTTDQPETKEGPKLVPPPGDVPKPAAAAADATQPAASKARTRKAAPRKKKRQSFSAAHLFSEMRHSPDQIRDLFRKGQYPYKTRIKRYMEHLNPRAARVVALEKPTDAEKGQWYFQRYIKQLPTRGEMVLFDRSWYNRAGVERVMDFCTSTEYLEFMRQVPDLERMLVRSGIRLFKYWFSVTQAEQQKRFSSRQKDPLKQWKLSPIDELSRDKWPEYTAAKEAMFFYTDTADAPWTIIKSDDKKRARLNCMQHFLASFEYPGKDHSVVHGPDPLIVGTPSQVIEKDSHLWD